VLVEPVEPDPVNVERVPLEVDDDELGVERITRVEPPSEDDPPEPPEPPE